MLGISRRTIQYRLQQWGLSRPSRGGKHDRDDDHGEQQTAPATPSPSPAGDA
jgi:hypothetical protein